MRRKIFQSKDVEFTTEKSAKSLLGSAMSGEGFVNVFRGTGIVMMSPVTSNYEPYPTVTEKSKPSKVH